MERYVNDINSDNDRIVMIMMDMDDDDDDDDDDHDTATIYNWKSTWKNSSNYCQQQYHYCYFNIGTRYIWIKQNNFCSEHHNKQEPWYCQSHPCLKWSHHQLHISTCTSLPFFKKSLTPTCSLTQLLCVHPFQLGPCRVWWFLPWSYAHPNVRSQLQWVSSGSRSDASNLDGGGIQLYTASFATM